MGHTEYTSEALARVADALGDEGQIHMINMVRYRDQADYGGTSALPPCSGREAYLQRYASAFKTVAAGETYSVFWIGAVQGVLVAPEGEAWDDVVIVQYSSFAALRRILARPEYETRAAPHRRAALADWRFMATTRVGAP